MKKIIDCLLPILLFISADVLLKKILLVFSLDGNVSNMAMAMLLPFIVMISSKNFIATFASVLLALIGLVLNGNMLLYVGLIGPINEEIIFRDLSIKECDWYQFILSSLIFAISHSGVVLQMLAFIFGIALCFIKKKYGLKACLFTHSLVNILSFIFI